jgi:magnesium transporter
MSVQLQSLVADHMTRDFLAAPGGQRVGEFLRGLQGRALGERIVYFYVIDDEGRLIGVVPTRRLLAASHEATMESIMIRRVVSLRPDFLLEDACAAFLLHRFLAFPVTDEEGRLLGVLDASVFTPELTEIAERQGFEDVFQLIGVHLQARAASPVAGFRLRFPWLMANLAGGLACALISASYESLLEQWVILALFIPIVLALAESVSIQSVTLTLQALHRGRPDLGSIARSLGRELLVALLLGMACGTLVGTISWAWKGQAAAAITIGGTITLAMITACLAGVLLPSLMRLLRLDPRVAAGPLVLATADICCLLFYFNLAGWILAA